MVSRFREIGPTQARAYFIFHLFFTPPCPWLTARRIPVPIPIIRNYRRCTHESRACIILHDRPAYLSLPLCKYLSNAYYLIEPLKHRRRRRRKRRCGKNEREMCGRWSWKRKKLARCFFALFS